LALLSVVFSSFLLVEGPISGFLSSQDVRLSKDSRGKALYKGQYGTTGLLEIPQSSLFYGSMTPG
jgi:hypothetical protein